MAVKVTYELVKKIEGELGEVLATDNSFYPVVNLEDIISSLGNLAFMVETVAHLQGKEAVMLPHAELARRQIALLKGGA